MLAALTEILYWILIVALLAAGLWFTVRSRFVQFRFFGRMFGILGQAFRRSGGKPTSFQALALSVSGRVGAGNIAGVAVAITLGGPGAIFWMWLVGLLGMATSFFECSLAQLFKRLEPSGNYRGGPAFYITRGLRKRLGAGAPALAGLYSVLLLVTFGLAFPTVQSYSFSTSFSDAFDMPKVYMGFLLASVLAIVIFGGVRRIARTAEIVVPVMAVAYIAVALFVIVTNIEAMPSVLGTIVAGAFGLEEAIGGGLGAALVMGVRRGLFSNEAGLGSAPNVAAVAYVRHPAQQGMVQALSVFIDTAIICTCTAAIILSSGIDIDDPTIDGVILTQNALEMHVGAWAPGFIAVALGFFAFTSIMYSYYLGETAIDYYTGENRLAFDTFRTAIVALAFTGSLMDLTTVFSYADVTMALLAFVNLFAVAMLFRIGLRILTDFDRQLKAGQDPVFDPADFADLEIDETAWEPEPADVPPSPTGAAGR
ncbi:MAG: alanine/glycine:cation symporter family protein [Alphaproteobacteria bacterium]